MTATDKEQQQPIKLLNFIGGHMVAPSEGAYLASLNPSTATVYASVPDSTSEDINKAVEAAKAAFPTWSKTPRKDRSALLIKVADLITERLEALAVAESRDQGKPVSLARVMDIPRAAENFRFFATYILHLEEKVTSLDGVAMSYVHRTPVGVTGLISPWNLPLYLLTWKIAPAIAYQVVGNTCVCKPSEFTSVTAFMLCSILNEAGIPPGVVNMVFGTGPRAGDALVKHPNVSLISFTGGTATGELIYRNCAPKFKKISLELGGKNPNIVFDDANLEEAVNVSVRSSFLNQGEICLCGSRIFVQDGIYDSFVKRLVEKANALVVGDPADPKTNVGALVSEQHLEKVQYYINIAIQEGGKVETGGNARLSPKGCENGFFLRPTIITGLGVQCRVLQEEIFGPVVTIVPFSTEEQAVEYANNVPYGLSASVWSENGRRARRVAEQLHVLSVMHARFTFIELEEV